MKLFCTLSIILFSISLSNAQWQKVNGPNNSNIIAFAKSGTKIFALGERDGVFFSNNNGDSWELTNNGLPINNFQRFYALEIDGTNLFLGTKEGAFLSTDNGNEWISINNGMPIDSKVYSFLMDGSNIYAGTSNGIFLSNNNGNDWTSASIGLPPETTVRAFALSGSNIFAGTTNGAFLSNNNGNSWIAINNGLPTFIYSLAIEGDNIYAGVSEGVYLSTDNGDSWELKNNGLPQSFGMWITVSGTNVYIGTTTGLFVSTDNGTTWTPIKDGLTNLPYLNNSMRAIMIDGADIFAGGNDGISLSTDNGISWNYRNNGLPFSGVNTLATNGDVVYASTEKGLYITNDNGASWTRKFTNFTSSVLAREENVYIGSHFGSIFVSNDYGENWTMSTGFFDNGEDVFATTGSTVFAKYNAGVFSGGMGFISTDNGLTYTANDIPYTVFANRADDKLFAVDSVVVSYNGNSWTPVSSIISNDSVFSLGVNSSRYFVGTKGGILKSPYNGNSWTKIDFGSAEAKTTELIVNGSKLYACTSNNELFSSSDNGNNWISVTDNFAETIIAHQIYGIKPAQLVINNTHIFVAAEDGIWIRPLPEVTSTKEQIPTAQFKVFPNPSSGRFMINSNEEISSLVVSNVLGKIVYKKLDQRFTSTEIDFSNFPQGIYLVTAFFEDKMQTTKIMIE